MTPTSASSSEGALGPSMFKVRLNDGPEAAGLIAERKCVLSPLDVVDKFSGTGAKSIFNACCTTMSFQLPLKRETVFNMQPFQISTCEILLELTSFAGTVPEVLIAALSQRTKHLAIGSGGVMLPNYSPLKVAEQFCALAALAPGRARGRSIVHALPSAVRGIRRRSEVRL